MNEKNKEKRQQISLVKTAHRHLKYIAADLDKTLEKALDHVVFEYAKKHPPIRMVRGTGE